MMFSSNPFAVLPVAPAVTQSYVVIMILLVVGGTLFDVLHKRSARYFFDNWRHARSRGNRAVSGAHMVSLAVQASAVDVLASGEFCNLRRRIAHLLTMYGFVAYLAATLVMVFGYPTSATPTPAIWPLLWYIGIVMVCGGGYWFWFFIRVDVAAEGHPPWRIVRADLFILSLLVSTTMAFIWGLLQTAESPAADVFLGLYVVATTVLFGAVPWSKFSHMFYKPAIAFQKRVAEADGSRSNLPPPADKPEALGRITELPRHY